MPVAAGSAGGAQGDALERCNYLQVGDVWADGESPGQSLMRLALGKCDDGSVTLVIVASLTDSATLLREAEALFVAKVKHVVIQGGVEPLGPSGGLMVPDSAHNNMCFHIRKVLPY